MDIPRVSKAIRAIIVIRPNSSGALTPTVLYENRRKKKKQMRALRPIENVTRRVTRAQRVFWNTIVEQHDRSNERKRDGWLRDGFANIVKANRKGTKQLMKIF
jgi:Family of unknown function (DUF6312)